MNNNNFSIVNNNKTGEPIVITNNKDNSKITVTSAYEAMELIKILEQSIDELVPF